MNFVPLLGPVGYILSWRIWTVLGKLTFGAYLTHGVWLAVYIYSQHQPLIMSSTTLVSTSTILISVSLQCSLLNKLKFLDGLCHLSSNHCLQLDDFLRIVCLCSFLFLVDMSRVRT